MMWIFPSLTLSLGFDFFTRLIAKVVKRDTKWRYNAFSIMETELKKLTCQLITADFRYTSTNRLQAQANM